MNIFYLDKNQTLCAQYHVDRHCVKMILEYSQLMSTAHRVLDGAESIEIQNNRRIKRWTLSNPQMDSVLYKATHINHPSAIWARKSKANYHWLCIMLRELCKEYTHRYGKVHKVERDGLMEVLYSSPVNISSNEFTEPTPAMPEEFKVPGNSVLSYHNYYNGSKTRLHSWKSRSVPYFITENNSK